MAGRKGTALMPHIAEFLRMARAISHHALAFSQSHWCSAKNSRFGKRMDNARLVYLKGRCGLGSRKLGLMWSFLELSSSSPFPSLSLTMTLSWLGALECAAVLTTPPARSSCLGARRSAAGSLHCFNWSSCLGGARDGGTCYYIELVKQR